MEYKDYYKILGVARTAAEDEIKRSYRKLARKYHPDVSKEPNAEEKFKEVQEAYEVLKDSKKRAAYDQLGSQWKSGQEFRPPPNWQGFADFGGGGAGFSEGNFEDFSDFFASIFGRAQQPGSQRASHHAPFHQRGRDEQAKISISLEEAYHGASKNIQLQLSQVDEHGRVHPIIRTLKLAIPAGVTPGQQLRLARQGGGAAGRGTPGDLYLEIDIQPHRIFTLQGQDVYLTLPITPWEVALGAKVAVPTLGGSVEVKITPGSQSGQKLRLKGRGLPGKPVGGDQYVLLQIVTPPAKTAAERALYEKMAKEMPFNPRKDLLTV